MHSRVGPGAILWIFGTDAFCPYSGSVRDRTCDPSKKAKNILAYAWTRPKSVFWPANFFGRFPRFPVIGDQLWITWPKVPRKMLLSGWKAFFVILWAKCPLSWVRAENFLWYLTNLIRNLTRNTTKNAVLQAKSIFRHTLGQIFINF